MSDNPTTNLPLLHAAEWSKCVIVAKYAARNTFVPVESGVILAVNDALAALQSAAPAAQQGEVVAWMLPRDGDDCAVFRDAQDHPLHPFAQRGWTPLYATPPQAAQPATITETDIADVARATGFVTHRQAHAIARSVSVLMRDGRGPALAFANNEGENYGL